MWGQLFQLMISKEEFERLKNNHQYDDLKAFKVDNAIILAAGLAKRFKPFSLIKPKALANIKGEVLIERQIKQLQAAGIEKIYVVVGYKKEEFNYLKKFNVELIENDSFDERNNTGSLILLENLLANSYICSSDNYFKTNVFENYNYKAYYAGVYKKGKTDEWCLKVDDNNEIIDVKIGGYDSYVMMGQVYFDRAFSQKFMAILKENYHQKEVKENVWEYLYLQHLDVLKMELKVYDDLILEFDSIEEVELFDSDFRKNNQDVFDKL